MALGKRKEREDNPEADEQPEHHGSTLFVSNLPYNATSTDLQTFFSEIAPVRNAFVVTEHGTGVSKGVGYVSFSVREDAQMAYEKIAKEGITLVGRSLRVQWAEQKSKVKMEKNEQSPQKKARPSHPKVDKTSHDPLAIRTIVISGLPGTIDSKTLWKKIRKYGGAEKVEWPVEKDGDGDASTAHAVFSTPSAAQDAIKKLHAHVFKGSILSVTLKKRLDNLASHQPKKPTTAISSKSSSTMVVATPSHANRLIVRNLPFTATESDLRSVFLSYGPIYTINMPLKDPSSSTVNNTSAAFNHANDPTTSKPEEEDDKQNDVAGTNASTNNARHPETLNKGFAFVWYYSRKDAQRAMEKCNGMLLRAGAAEELVKGKQKRKKERRLERKLALLRERKQTEGDVKVEDENKVKIEGDEGDGEENEEEKKISKEDKNERVIAVDWALSKDRWEEEKARIEEELNNAESEEESPDSGDEEGGEGLSVHEDDEGSSEASDEDEDQDEGEKVERDEDDEPVKPQLPQTDIGTTLFIRNLPYDVTEDELRTLFRSFGPLRYARITLDPTTGRSRGTGFACFWNKEDADKVVQQSELLRAETTGANAIALPKKKNPFTFPSILTPDPSSSLAQNLVLHGRALDVVRAVTRDEAGKLKEAGERAREKADKRNMYLLREGVILPNSPEASSISVADLQRRTNSYNARRALLKSNPSLYISKTRLSVRQIPVYVTDLMLKRLALHAVRAFEKDVKQAERSGLSTVELEDLGGRPGKTPEEGEDEVDKASDAESETSSTSTGTTLSKSAKRKAELLKKLGLGGVKQAKIIRQAERVDPITGKGKSRGYGFVEMHTHADALRLLRWANNHPDVLHLLRRWWKEELERLIKIERQKLKKDKDKAGEDDKKGESEARLKRMMNELEKEKHWEEQMKSRGKDEKDDEDNDKHGTRDSRRTLIVEFSIENIQVIQRRNAVQRTKAAVPGPEMEGKKMLGSGRQHQLSKRGIAGHRRASEHEPDSGSHSFKPKGGKRAREMNDKGGEGDSAKQQREKKRRLSIVDSSGDKVQGTGHQNEEGKEPDTRQSIGSIIGRKRKERKARKGKGKA